MKKKGPPKFCGEIREFPAEEVDLVIVSHDPIVAVCKCGAWRFTGPRMAGESDRQVHIRVFSAFQTHGAIHALKRRVAAA
jgi:hypothetical protein